MSEIRKVCILENGAEIPLTASIADENKQALAYSMLYHLAGNGARISVDGMDVSFDKNNLRLVSEYGVRGRHYTKPHLDPEWYGANGQNFIKEDPLAVSVLMDGDPVPVMPFTGCANKAYEAERFLKYGFLPRVSLSIPGKDGQIPVIEKEEAVNPAVTDFSGKVRDQEFSNDWDKLVSGNVIVKGRARVSDFAVVIGNDKLQSTVLEDDAKVIENAQISGDVTVSGEAMVKGRAKVLGVAPGASLKEDNRLDPRFHLAYLGDHAVADGNALVVNGCLLNHAHVSGNAAIICSPFDGSATIKGDAEIGGNARILNGATISGEAKIGEAEIKKQVKIGHDALIMDSEDIFHKGDITAYRNQNDGVTVSYKKRFYNGIEAFKIAKGDYLNEKDKAALWEIEDHFGYFDAAGFEKAVGSIKTDSPEMGQ